jgi:hypothetical protein
MKKDTLTAAEFRVAVRNIKRDFGDDVDGANQVIANMTDVWEIIPDPQDPDLIPKPIVKPVEALVITDDAEPAVATLQVDEARVKAVVLSRNPYTPLSQVSEYEWNKARELVGIMALEPKDVPADIESPLAGLSLAEAKEAVRKLGAVDRSHGYDMRAVEAKAVADKEAAERKLGRDLGYPVIEPIDKSLPAHD